MWKSNVKFCYNFKNSIRYYAVSLKVKYIFVKATPVHKTMAKLLNKIKYDNKINICQ